MDDLYQFVQKLGTDPKLRENFATDPKGVLEQHGIDTSAYDIPDRIDLPSLESRLAVLPQVQTGAIKSPGSESSIVDESSMMSFDRPITAPSEAQAVATAQHGGAEATLIFHKGQPLPEFAGTVSRPEAAQEVDVDARYPDVWFASFGTSVSRVLAGRQEETDRMVAEIVIGNDDRVPISNVQNLPFLWICQLVITAANGTTWLGTGWLATPRLVITAGHCVYLHNQGGWVRRVDVFPARNGTDRPFSFTSFQPHSVEGWVYYKRAEFDYGALILQPGVNNVGFFGYGALEDVNLVNLLANIAGYPSDRPPGTLWGHTRSLMSIRPTTLFYDIDTYGGMSGAPVIRWDGNDYIVVGIHNYGDLAGNQATRITPAVFQNIELWKSLVLCHVETIG